MVITLINLLIVIVPLEKKTLEEEYPLITYKSVLVALASDIILMAFSYPLIYKAVIYIFINE